MNDHIISENNNNKTKYLYCDENKKQIETLLFFI